MVYIKLAESLYQKIKEHILPDKLVACNKQLFIAYPEFKRIALAHSLPLHRQIGRQDIITYTQMDQLIEQEKQTPQQRRLIEELKNKRELRLLNKINPKREGNDYYFQGKKDGGSIKEMTETISYSMAFIFTFFMGGLTGYYVGAFFLGWSLAHSLMLALVFMVVTLIIETSLFILKQAKKQRQQKGGTTSIPTASASTGSTKADPGFASTNKKKKQ